MTAPLAALPSQPKSPGELSNATRWLMGRKVFELILETRKGGADYLHGVADRYAIASVELASTGEHDDIATILGRYSLIARGNAERIALGLEPINPVPHLKLVAPTGV